MGGCGDCCSMLSKIVLVTLNLIFCLASILMLAFGIAGKANPDAVQKIFDYLIPADERANLQGMGVDLTNIVASNSVFMIIVGVVGLVISIVGFVGACCTVRWMLIGYAILLILLLLAEIALIIFAAVWASSFQQYFQAAMNQTIATEFDQDVTVYSNGTVVLPTSIAALSWAGVQLKSNCCGAYNYSDYATASKWTNRAQGQIPLSCCAQTADSTQNQYKFVNAAQCVQGNATYINKQNCYVAVEKDITNFINNYKGIAIGIAAGIVGLELILIAMAIFLCARHDGKDNFV